MVENGFSTEFSTGTRMSLFEGLLSQLQIPRSCLLNKPLYKKMFLDHASLDAKDKKALKEDVVKIRWLYTLKPSTVNIATYVDELRDFTEIAVIQVNLNKVKNVEHIGQMVNKAIPYPLIIFFVHSEIADLAEPDESSNNEQISICLADKRINKADKEKWVIESLQCSPWVHFGSTNSIENAFLSSLVFSELPHNNFWQFYQAWLARVQALQCAEISGRFNLAKGPEAEEQRKTLDRYHQIEQEITKLRTQIKKAEFSQQVQLNTQIKQQEQQLKNLADCL